MKKIALLFILSLPLLTNAQPDISIQTYDLKREKLLGTMLIFYADASGEMKEIDVYEVYGDKVIDLATMADNVRKHTYSANYYKAYEWKEGLDGQSAINYIEKKTVRKFRGSVTRKYTDGDYYPKKRYGKTAEEFFDEKGFPQKNYLKILEDVKPLEERLQYCGYTFKGEYCSFLNEGYQIDSKIPNEPNKEYAVIAYSKVDSAIVGVYSNDPDQTEQIEFYREQMENLNYHLISGMIFGTVTQKLKFTIWTNQKESGEICFFIYEKEINLEDDVIKIIRSADNGYVNLRGLTRTDMQGDEYHAGILGLGFTAAATGTSNNGTHFYYVEGKKESDEGKVLAKKMEDFIAVFKIDHKYEEGYINGAFIRRISNNDGKIIFQIVENESKSNNYAVYFY